VIQPLNSSTFAASKNEQHSSLQTFDQLGLSDELVKALSEKGITSPTQIQQEAIPHLLESPKDFLGLAQTGTGKTAAFGLPLLDIVDPTVPVIQAVIMSPTRELAQQIQVALKEFAKHKPRINVNVVYGGAAITNQMRDLKRQKPQIVVATPGRLLDLINRKAISLEEARIVILDEADEMLNMGFKEDIDKILSKTHGSKNTWLFSATMPPDIRDIVHRYMDNPVEVSVKTSQRVNQNIEHYYALVRRGDRVEALQRLVDASQEMYAVIFCRTKIDTQRLAASMGENGYNVEAIHGDLSQAQRDAVMKRFKAGRTRLLAATDVAARGIDVDNLTHVIHYELPDDLAFYTHRSGRTARAGKKGVAIAFIAPEISGKPRWIEKQLGITMSLMKIPQAQEVIMKKVQNELDGLLASDVDHEVSNWLPAFQEQVEHLTKDDLLALWLAHSMQGLKTSGRDLNAEPRKGRGGERDSRAPGHRGRRTEDSGKPYGGKPSRGGGSVEKGMQRFSVNLGKADKLRKGDLLRILCDSSGVRSKYIGRIDMQGQQSYIDVKEQKSGSFARSLDGLQFKGRKIRVRKA